MTVLEIAAIAIAVVAFVLAMVDHWRQRRHDRLSVTPALEFHGGVVAKFSRLALRNAGVGPARIKQIKVRIDGEILGLHWNRKTILRMERLLGLERVGGYQWTYFEDTPMIGAGEEIVLLQCSPDTPEEIWALVGAIVRRLEMTCEYQSLYREDYSTSWGPHVEAVEGRRFDDLKSAAIKAQKEVKLEGER